MTVSVGVSSAWKAVNKVQVGVSSAWKTVSAGWVGVGGVWKRFYSSVYLQDHSMSVSGSTKGGGASGTFTVTNDGDLTWTLNIGTLGSPSPAFDATEWNGSSTKTAGDGDAYHVKMTYVSGPSITNSGSWLALTSSQAFVASTAGTSVHTLELSLDGGSTVLASCTITITVTIT